MPSLAYVFSHAELFIKETLYLFPQKVKYIKETRKHRLIEQFVSYNALFSSWPYTFVRDVKPGYHICKKISSNRIPLILFDRPQILGT